MIGELSALVTAFLWSATSMVFSAATTRAGVMYVNVTRLLFALCFLFASVLILKLPVDLSMPQFIYLAVSGVIGLVLGDTFLFRAFKEIGARVSMLVMSLVPAICAVLAFFFLNESLTLTSLVGMAITISGIALVVLERHDEETYGIASREAGCSSRFSPPSDRPSVSSSQKRLSSSATYMDSSQHLFES
jgi:drug/metabolite transporter (DMT)-like permease